MAPIKTITDFVPPNTAEALALNFQDKPSDFFEKTQTMSYDGKVWGVKLITSLDDEGAISAVFIRVHSDKEMYIWDFDQQWNPDQPKMGGFRSTLSFDCFGRFFSRANSGGPKPTRPGSAEETGSGQNLFFTKIFNEGTLVETTPPKIHQLIATRLQEIPLLSKEETLRNSLFPLEEILPYKPLEFGKRNTFLIILAMAFVAMLIDEIGKRYLPWLFGK